VPIKRGSGDGAVFPYNDVMYHDIIEKAKKQREAMDVRPYETQPVTATATVTTATAEYEPENLSSVESTAQMT
jgi:hypothetical protein